MVPENELGVIVRFAQECEQHGWSFVSIRSEFPDAVLEKGGEEYRTEFEFDAVNFRTHRHDPRQCELIVCWQNSGLESCIPVLELSKESCWNTGIIIPSLEQREIEFWKERATYWKNEAAKWKSEAEAYSGSIEEEPRVYNSWHDFARDYPDILTMSGEEIGRLAGVSGRTGRNWKLYALEGTNGHQSN